MNQAAVTNLSADLYHLVRLSALGASLVLPLQGAASADATLNLRRAVGLVGVAAAFHGAVYLDNDLCDLELDRTQPLRAHYPLVRGAISPAQARALALACGATSLALDGVIAAPGRHRTRRASLGAALLLLAVYNRWGKRCPLPPLTDLVQACGWVALLRYGAEATGQPPNRLTKLLAGYELGLIMLVNGVHGPLRDLANDAACGARTTALWLGARIDPNDRMVVPPALAAYALVLQLVLVGMLGAAAAQPQTSARGRWGAALVVLLTVGLLVRAARGRLRAVDLGMLHLILILSAPVALVAPAMQLGPQLVLLAAHAGPLLINRMTYEALRDVGF
ncbi:MAG: UbiA family prenyltransferase [Oscillochloridaceae bacterium umkhey_bin13]